MIQYSAWSDSHDASTTLHDLNHYKFLLITKIECLQLVFFFFFFGLFAISWATPVAYGGSQDRGRIGAVATDLRQSHSNSGSEPRLQPTPQLTATPDG